MKTRDVMDLLNDGLRLDQQAMQGLIDTRVPCNQALANHPTIRVRPGHSVGLLGIINGILGKIEQPLLAAIYEDGKVVGFLQTKEKVGA